MAAVKGVLNAQGAGDASEAAAALGLFPSETDGSSSANVHLRAPGLVQNEWEML